MSSRRRVTLHGANTIIEANKQQKGSVFERLGGDDKRSTRKVQRTNSGGLSNRNFGSKRSHDMLEPAEPCRMWLKTGDCPYGDKCKNSHSDHRRPAERSVHDDSGVREEYRQDVASKSFVVTSQQRTRHQRTVTTAEHPSSVAQKRQREQSPSPQPAHKRRREENTGGERRQSQKVSSAIVVQAKNSRSPVDLDDRRTPKKRSSRSDGRSSAPSSVTTKQQATDRKSHSSDRSHSQAHAARSGERNTSERSERMYRDDHRRTKSEGLSQHGSPALSSSSRNSSWAYHEPVQLSHRHHSPSEWEREGHHRLQERPQYHLHSPPTRSSHHSGQWHDSRYVVDPDYRRSSRSGHHYGHTEVVPRGRDSLASTLHDRHSHLYRRDRSVRTLERESERQRSSHRSSLHSHVDSRSFRPSTLVTSTSSRRTQHHHNDKPTSSSTSRHRHEDSRMQQDQRSEEAHQRKAQRRSPGETKKQVMPSKSPLPNEEIFSPVDGCDSHTSDEDSVSPIRSPIHSSPSRSPSPAHDTDREEQKGQEDEVVDVGKDETGEEVGESEEEEGTGVSEHSASEASNVEQLASSDEEPVSGSSSERVESESENDTSVHGLDEDVPGGGDESDDDLSSRHSTASATDHAGLPTNGASDTEQQEGSVVFSDAEEEEEVIDVTVKGSSEPFEDDSHKELDEGKQEKEDPEAVKSSLAGKEHKDNVRRAGGTPMDVSSKEKGKKPKAAGTSKKLKTPADAKKRQSSQSPAPEPTLKKERSPGRKSLPVEKKVADKSKPLNDIFDEFSPENSPFPDDTVADDFEVAESATDRASSHGDGVAEMKTAIKEDETCRETSEKLQVRVEKAERKEVQVGLSNADLYDNWSDDDENSLAVLRHLDPAPAPVRSSEQQRGLGALYEDMDAFSDDDLDAILHNEGPDDVDMEDDDLSGELALEARSVEDVDWSVLGAPTQPADVSAGECLERFSTDKVLRSIGLSSSLAGPELTERVEEICLLDESECKAQESFAGALGLGAVTSSLWGALAERKALLMPQTRALSAREDLSLRRRLQLLNVKMKGLASQQPSVIVSNDNDLLRISLNVYQRTVQGVGTESAAKSEITPSAVGSVLAVIA